MFCWTAWALCIWWEEDDSEDDEEPDSGSITLIMSPDTMPQEERVCPVSTSGSFPFSDRLNSVSALGSERGTHIHTHTKTKHRCVRLHVNQVRLSSVYAPLALWKCEHAWVQLMAAGLLWLDCWVGSGSDRVPPAPSVSSACSFSPSASCCCTRGNSHHTSVQQHMQTTSYVTCLLCYSNFYYKQNPIHAFTDLVLELY